MSWSNLWQGGGRKQESGNQKSRNKSKHGKGSEARAAASGPETVTLAWLAADGTARCEVAPVHSHTDDQIGVQLSEAIEPDTPVWLISADGFERAGAVRACNVQQNRLIGHVALRTAVEDLPDRAATLIQWIEPGGETVACTASLTAKGDGRIRVSLPGPLPASAVVRIAGLEYQCLAVSDSCRQAGESWLADVDVISPSLPLPQRVAA